MKEKFGPIKRVELKLISANENLRNCIRQINKSQNFGDGIFGMDFFYNIA
jgi:hypothetical protein